MRGRGVRRQRPAGRGRRRGAQLRVPRLDRPGDHVRDHPRQRRCRSACTPTRCPYPVATSFAVEVYRILPNDTDFTPFRRVRPVHRAELGLHRRLRRSTTRPRTSPSYMDQGSLQQQGDNALALARAFGDADLRRAGRCRRRGRHLLPGARPAGPLSRLAGLAVGVLALLAVGGAGVPGPRVGGGSRGGGSLAGFGLAFDPAAARAGGGAGVLGVAGGDPARLRDMIDPWRPGWFRAAVVALVATVLLAWYGLLRRRFGAWALALGGPAVLAVPRARAGRRHARRVVPGRAARAGRRAAAVLVAR